MPKYVIRKSRYIDGVFIAADPEHPATIDLPEGTKVDHELFAVGDVRGTVTLKPHYVPGTGKRADAEPVASAVGHTTSPGPSDARLDAEAKVEEKRQKSK